MSLFCSAAPTGSLENCDIILDRTLFPRHHPATADDILGLLQELKSNSGVVITKILSSGIKVEKTLRLDESGLFLVYTPTLKTVVNASIFIPSISEVRTGPVGYAFHRTVVMPERLPYCLSIMLNDNNAPLCFMFQEGSMHVWLNVLHLLMKRARRVVVEYSLKIRLMHLWLNCALGYTKELHEAKTKGGIMYSVMEAVRVLTRQVRETANTLRSSPASPKHFGGKEPTANASLTSPLGLLNSSMTSPPEKVFVKTLVKQFQVNALLVSLSAPQPLIARALQFLPNESPGKLFEETAYFFENIIFASMYEVEPLFDAAIELDDIAEQQKQQVKQTSEEANVYGEIEVVRSTTTTPVESSPPVHRGAGFDHDGPQRKMSLRALRRFFEQFQHQSINDAEACVMHRAQRLFSPEKTKQRASFLGRSTMPASSSNVARSTSPDTKSFVRRDVQQYDDEHDDGEEEESNSGFTFSQFCALLFDPEHNSWFKPHHSVVYQDMTQPVCHYFINSSHNTYLTGDQFASNSSTEMYRISLLRGCRCLELDCWDGDDGKPIIYHGHTRTSRISFREVVETINEYAFVTSSYPVFLSLEVHTNLHQQHLMAVNMYTVFGPHLLYMSNDDFNNVAPANASGGTYAYTPEGLKNKIVVKSKRKIEHYVDRRVSSMGGAGGGGGGDSDEQGSGDEQGSAFAQYANAADDKADKEETDSETDGEGDQLRITASETTSSSLQQLSLSDVVGMPACRCLSLKDRMKSGQPYEVSSFGETRALNVAQKERFNFIKLNKLMCSRTYPKGSRINSSNYHPQPMWNVGCQLVALNFQTYDFPLRYNDAKFEQNGRCGFILKPAFLRANLPKQPPLPPGTRISPYRGSRCHILRVKVLGGLMIHRPTFSAEGQAVNPFVKVFVSGVPEDESTEESPSAGASGTAGTAPNGQPPDKSSAAGRTRSTSGNERFTYSNRVCSTDPAFGNGINPFWMQEFSFNIVFIDLACLTLRVCHYAVGQQGQEICEATIPVCSLRLGYRAVPLRSVKTNFLMNYSSLLCHFALQEV